MNGNELIVMPRRDRNEIVAQNTAIVELKANVFQSGLHYGEPYKGAGKPTLLKPGVELLCSMFGLRPRFVERVCVEQWDTEKPLFHYRYECELVDINSGLVVGSGIGSCNSLEDKYRWRNAERKCPNCEKENIRKSKDGSWYCWTKTGGCGQTFKANDPAIVDQVTGKVLNTEVFTLVNTIDKMAQKRALTAAVLVATGASAFFTQDVEDFPGYAHIVADEGEVIDAAPHIVEPAPQPIVQQPIQPKLNGQDRRIPTKPAPKDENEVGSLMVFPDGTIKNVEDEAAILEAREAGALGPFFSKQAAENAAKHTAQGHKFIQSEIDALLTYAGTLRPEYADNKNALSKSCLKALELSDWNQPFMGGDMEAAKTRIADRAKAKAAEDAEKAALKAAKESAKQEAQQPTNDQFPFPGQDEGEPIEHTCVDCGVITVRRAVNGVYRCQRCADDIAARSLKRTPPTTEPQ